MVGTSDAFVARQVRWDVRPERELSFVLGEGQASPGDWRYLAVRRKDSRMIWHRGLISYNLRVYKVRPI